MRLTMTSKKRSVKVSAKKLMVTAAPTPKKIISKSKKEKHLGDNEFQKKLTKYMKEKESLMRNLSKR